MKRHGVRIIAVLSCATLFLAASVPCFSQKTAANTGQGSKTGTVGSKIPPGPKGELKLQAVPKGTFDPSNRVPPIPGVPARNVIKSSLKKDSLMAGRKGPFSIDEAKQRIKNAQGGRGGPPQDRDITLTAADVLQPFYANADTRVWLATNATGVDTATRLAYDGTGLAYHLWSVDRDGKNAVQRTGKDSTVPEEVTGEQMYPHLNIASNVLVYSHRNTPGAGDFKVRVRNLGTGQKPISIGIDTTIPLGDMIHPRLSSTGDVVFSARLAAGGTYKIFIAKSNGTAYNDGKFVHQMTDGGTSDDLTPDWAPTADRIVFTRRAPDGSSRVYVAFLTNPIFIQQYTNFSVTGTPSKDKDPVFRSDGARLLFASTRKARVSGKLAFRVAATEIGTSYDIYMFNPTIPENTTNNFATSLTADPMDGIGEGATDPTEAFKQNAFAYISDRPNPPVSAGLHDAWEGLFADVTPPLLEELPVISVDNATGNKEGSPGSQVMFAAHVTDLQTGVAKVYAQFKDPDGAEFDTDGVEHRLYLLLSGEIPAPFGQLAYPQTGRQMDLFVEIGQEVVNPFNYGFAFPWSLFVGAVGDADLRDGLQLYDDGPVSGGGHEQECQVKGDDIYTNVWTTPLQASDFYLDILVEDVAGNQLIYDNISGFTTQAFVSKNPILFVADYIAGQLFVQDLNFNPNLGQQFARTTWAPVESYWTRNPATHGTHATFYSSTGAPAEPYWPFGQSSAFPRTGQTLDTLGPAAIYNNCDVWRTECRNPISPAIVNQYLPRLDDQVDPSNPGSTRQVLVAERAVVWANPYTKDLWTGPVGLDRESIRTVIKQYMDLGGRLVASGQDVAWGLTQGGQIQSDLLSNYFKARYDTDNGADVDVVQYQALRHDLRDRHDIVSSAPWDYTWPRPDGSIDNVDANGFTQDFLADPSQLLKIPGIGLVLLVPGLAVTGNFIGIDGAWNQLWIDAVTLNGTAQIPNLWAPFEYREVGPAGPYAAVATSNSGTRSKTMLMAFGLEGVHSAHRIVQTALGPFAYSDSRRYEILHGALSWMRTARAYGQVFSIDPQTLEKKPEPGVLVRWTQGSAKDPTYLGQIYAGLTDSDGQYMILGLTPGHFFVDAVKPGFRIQHPEVIYGLHGGEIERYTGSDGNTMDLIITKEPPGSVTGKVVNQNGDPLQNVTVIFTSTFPGVPDETTITDAAGKFIMTIAPGTYTVTVDGTAIGYSNTSDPASVSVKVDSGLTVAIDTGHADPPGKDAFILFAAVGNATGKVTDCDSGDPIQGAQVVAKITRFGQPVVVGPVITDANGDYDFTAAGLSLPPGTYQLVVSAIGYQGKTVSADVTSGGNVVTPVCLNTVPPRVLRSYVKVKLGSGSSFEDAPENMPVNVYLNNILVCTAMTFKPSQISTGHQYNVEFTESCKLGDNANKYKLVVDTTGFGLKQSADIMVLVPDGASPADGKPAYSLDIVLEALHTFSKFNNLVSTPYNYSGMDPKILLDGTSSFRFSTWDTGTGLFIKYPSAPANEFIIGKGYFLSDSKSMALKTSATTADVNSLFPIPIKAGWNLIGDPFLFEVRLEGSQVSGPTGIVSFTQAVANGWVNPVIYTVTDNYPTAVFTLRTWVGYWFYAFTDVTLLVDPTSKPGGFGPDAFSNPSDGWRLNLQVSTSNGVKDMSSMIGVSQNAANGYDSRYDFRRPPQQEGDFIQIAFRPNDWGANNGLYMSDIRSASTLQQTWKFNVETNVAGADVTLRWPSLSHMARGINLVLVDETTGKRIFMRSNSSYLFKMGQAGGRPFRIETISANQILRITNPVAQSSRGGVSISYSLTSEANVQVTVLGPTGKAIRQLTNNVAAHAGAQSVSWDGRDGLGIALPPGAYTIEVRASTEDDQIARTVTPVVLTR